MVNLLSCASVNRCRLYGDSISKITSKSNEARYPILKQKNSYKNQLPTSGSEPNLLGYISCKYFRTKRITIEPSPTAAEIPVMALKRTSPEAKIPGTLVSVMKGSLFSFQRVLNDLFFNKSLPLRISPFSSVSTRLLSQALPGLVPI